MRMDAASHRVRRCRSGVNALSDEEFVLRLSCIDRPGIVAAISGFLFQNGFNILEAQQFDDVLTGRFFARLKFGAVDGAHDLGALRPNFAPSAQSFGLDWTLTSPPQPHHPLP